MFLRHEFKRRRIAAGMNQTEFGEASGLSQQVVSDYESGRCEPSPSTLQAIARTLGCDPLDLLVEVAS